MYRAGKTLSRMRLKPAQALEEVKSKSSQVIGGEDFPNADRAWLGAQSLSTHQKPVKLHHIASCTTTTSCGISKAPPECE